MRPWKGVIIEESLTDRKLLSLSKVFQTKTGTLETQEARGSFHFHSVEIPQKNTEAFVNQAKQLLKPGWYIHLCRDDDMIVIYQAKVFEFKKGQREKMDQAKRYGEKNGIPKEQLTFEYLFENPLS